MGKLSKVLGILGEYENAKNYGYKSLEIYKKNLLEFHINCVFVLENLAGVLKDLGDYDAAKVFLLKALEISKKHFGEDNANYGNI